MRTHITPDGRFASPIPAGQPWSEGSAQQIEVMLNWFEELRMRVHSRNSTDQCTGSQTRWRESSTLGTPSIPPPQEREQSPKA